MKKLFFALAILAPIEAISAMESLDLLLEEISNIDCTALLSKDELNQKLVKTMILGSL